MPADVAVCVGRGGCIEPRRESRETSIERLQVAVVAIDPAALLSGDLAQDAQIDEQVDVRAGRGVGEAAPVRDPRNGVERALLERAVDTDLAAVSRTPVGPVLGS
jgi:hypothetical protein